MTVQKWASAANRGEKRRGKNQADSMLAKSGVPVWILNQKIEGALTLRPDSANFADLGFYPYLQIH